jgi:hemerythrin superfamily protein
MKDEVIYEFVAEPVGAQQTEQPLDAVSLLKKDHKEVQNLLRRALKAQGKELQQLAQQICMQLTVHTQLEEQLIYPLLQQADEELAIEAYTEHSLAKMLVKEIEGMSAKDVALEPKLKVLNELVSEHIKEEEKMALPELEKSGMADLQELGLQMSQRKEQLLKRLQSKKSASSKSSAKKSAGKKSASKRSSKTSAARSSSRGKTTAARKSAASKSKKK